MHPRLTVDQYLTGILQGDRVILGKAITLVESQLGTDRLLSEALLDRILPHTGNSIRIAVSGAPGVGKSTFIESIGKAFVNSGRKLAVLAVDPSSTHSGGSILGDKIRMERLSKDEGVFIRPSSAGNFLGGVAGATYEAIHLCEAAGYDLIVIETVGVGQSEIDARHMADFFILLTLPGAGDEIQGIKRGITEMADLIVVSKVDGENIEIARHTLNEYQNALQYLPPSDEKLPVKVLACSAVSGEGIPDIWETIQAYTVYYQNSGGFDKNRRIQQREWTTALIKKALENAFFTNETIKTTRTELEKQIEKGLETPFGAVKKLLDLFQKR